MIVLGEKRENLNVIHLIVGPESDFQFDLTGQCVIDITNHYKQTKDGDTVIIVINKCNSEEQLAAELARRNIVSSQQQMMEEFSKFMEQKGKTDEKESTSNLKCPKCLKDSAGIVENGLVKPCKQCQLIDQNKKNIDIPEPLSSEKQKELLKELKTKNPKGFNLLKRLSKRAKKEEVLPPPLPPPLDVPPETELGDQLGI